MENKDNYYTPELEDFFVGYECEILTPKGYKKGVFPEVFDKNPELNEFGEDYLQKAAHAILRTPCLTTKQLESEGWEFLDDYNSTYTKGNTWLIDHKKNYYSLMIIDVSKSEIAISCGGDVSVIYQGKIKSINELRLIEKLLEI